jgi:hypothetical protein
MADEAHIDIFTGERLRKAFQSDKHRGGFREHQSDAATSTYRASQSRIQRLAKHHDSESGQRRANEGSTWCTAASLRPELANYRRSDRVVVLSEKKRTNLPGQSTTELD